MSDAQVTAPPIPQDPLAAMRFRAELEKEKREQDMLIKKQAGDQIGALMGNPELQQETAPFVQDESMLFEGESQIPGLESITQEASPSTGMFMGSTPEQSALLSSAKGMIETGNPLLQDYGFDSLSKVQNDMALMGRNNARQQPTFAMGAPENIVNGVNTNAGKMIRAIPANNDLGFETLGSAYDPRSQLVDTGTEFVNQYNPDQKIEKNLTEAARRTQQGKSEVLDWFTKNKDLRDSEGGRIAGMKKAKKFLELFESGEMNSGGARKALSYLPFTFTKQGRMDEEFNSFAETAARQALKQSGEVRPTDADVTGMKRAMFGIGRDEQVNMNLLQDFIDSAESGEYKQYLVQQGESFLQKKQFSKKTVERGNSASRSFERGRSGQTTSLTSPSGIKYTVK